MKNNKLYADVYKLCKFMKRMAEYQKKKKLPRIRISIDKSDFPVPNIDRKEKEKLYNFIVSSNLCNTLGIFECGYQHFRSISVGKPDNSINIYFYLKKSNKDKIVIDKSSLLINGKVNIYIYVKENEFNYSNDIQIFICRFVTNNFRQLEMREYKPGFSKPINEDYQDIIKRESYTQEELLKLYPLPELD